MGRHRVTEPNVIPGSHTLASRAPSCQGSPQARCRGRDHVAVVDRGPPGGDLQAVVLGEGRDWKWKAFGRGMREGNQYRRGGSLLNGNLTRPNVSAPPVGFEPTTQGLGTDW